ncbi:MAG TPA: NAD(P)H-dependent glycerol-3-phosphate dehydrogenase [Xanthobacteraceae bacterium]|nr:NAD(P)H-dependent glycerol-3-phosphate dehydrogenase [Xanthobacteraceae bacterium]
MAVFRRIAILGAGAWGSALANAVARAGRSVTLYARDPTASAEIAKSRTNAARLPGVAIAAEVAATNSLGEAAEADALLLAVPTAALRELASSIASMIRPGVPLVACAKGIEQGSEKFVTEILADVSPLGQAAILSGPSFAADVGRGLPTAVTLGARDESLASDLAAALSSPAFRLYHSTDVRGIEIGGAAKNVLAIAAGIVVGRGLGASAQAALTTRGFAELSRLGRAFGARPETLMGLSGLGDLILTCSSPQSRNYAFGLAVGRGRSPEDLRSGPLAEGALTAPVLVEIARKKGIEMPIAQAVNGILSGRINVEEAISGLLSRPLKAEA